MKLPGEVVKFVHENNEHMLVVKDCQTNCDEATFSIAIYPKLTIEAQQWIKENMKANDLIMNVPIRTVQFDYTKSNALVKLALWMEETQILFNATKKVKEIEIIFKNPSDAAAFKLFFGIKKDDNSN
jgi:hypothetical protein